MISSEMRREYAEEIRRVAKIGTPALVDAFATVPREDFVGPAPWRILSKPTPGQMRPQMIDVTEPSELYQDVAVFLDTQKMLTNGNPSTLAPWLDSLRLAPGKRVFHLGCGTGYYTAVMAEVVGPDGRVTAVEVDPLLAERARTNLRRYGQVEVIAGDGHAVDTGENDAILINAGVTHPTQGWLDNLAESGTLLFPMTVEFGSPNLGKGLALCVSRSGTKYSATFLPAPVVIYSCASVRDPELVMALEQKMMSGTFGSVRSLRRDAHESDTSCWLHTPTFCLSTMQSGV